MAASRLTRIPLAEECPTLSIVEAGVYAYPGISLTTAYRRARTGALPASRPPAIGGGCLPLSCGGCSAWTRNLAHCRPAGAAKVQASTHQQTDKAEAQGEARSTDGTRPDQRQGHHGQEAVPDRIKCSDARGGRNDRSSNRPKPPRKERLADRTSERHQVDLSFCCGSGPGVATLLFDSVGQTVEKPGSPQVGV